MDALMTMLLLSDMLKGLMPLGGLMLIVIGLMMMLRKRRRKAHQHESPMERVERYQQQRGMHDDLEAVMVEVEQLARRFSSQLDAKSVQLEKLIREADERISQLEQLPALETSPEVFPANLKPQVSPPPETPEYPLTQWVYRLADQGHNPADIAQKLDEHVGKVELILALRK